MSTKVVFSIGRFGPFEGQLSAPEGENSQEYKLTFGPLYVNATALSNEKYIHVQKSKRTILEGIYSGIITVDEISHATFGDLTIKL